MKNLKKTIVVNPSVIEGEHKLIRLWTLTLLLVLSAVSLASAQQKYSTKSGTDAYIAEIKAINPQLTDKTVSGEAIFIISENTLDITLVVKGVSPDMMHLQHIHGFMDGRAGKFPPASADTNGDGIIDLMETHDYTGKTLIPFNGAPVDLQIKSDTYPVASKDGLLTYHISVPLDKLNSAIKKEYNIDKLALENRVIFIHGVPEGDKLPDSVQSLPGVPAHVTVPIACGVIKGL